LPGVEQAPPHLLGPHQAPHERKKYIVGRWETTAIFDTEIMTNFANNFILSKGGSHQ
jgi:hypothetical protein